MQKAQVTLGIDIGGTNTVFGLIGEDGKQYYHNSVKTEADRDPELLFNKIYDHVNSFVENSEMDLLGIGVGAPNANYYTNKIENAVNLSWGTVNVVDILSKLFDTPAFITNDANAAALGEKQFGEAEGMEDFIEITLGTGLGSGIVVNGELVYGHDGFAGELGHIKVIENGRECGCGNRGCLETYASATGLVRTTLEFLSKFKSESELRDIPPNKLTSKKVYKYAQKGDKIAQQAFSETGRILGRALANFVAALSPEAIILYGGLANANDLIVGPVKEALEKNVMSTFKNKVDILISGLPEDKAAVMGTAGLAWHEIQKEN